VPRGIFTQRDGERKAEPGFAERATPLSQAEKLGQPPKNELDAWRRKMAEHRRQSLAEGIAGLLKRKKRMDRQVAVRNKAKSAAHRAAQLAPESPDEVLLRSTVLGSTARETTVGLDEGRFVDAEAGAKRNATLRQSRKEARQDALAQLYVAAKDFIVTEEQLVEEIDRLFSEDYFRKQGGLAMDSSNIWDARGHPMTVAAMLNSTNRSQGSNILMMNQTEAARTARRQKIVAEELTGGKMQ
jgi:hypothetical protein